jgi:hypothetical protein
MGRWPSPDRVTFKGYRDCFAPISQLVSLAFGGGRRELGCSSVAGLFYFNRSF